MARSFNKTALDLQRILTVIRQIDFDLPKNSSTAFDGSFSCQFFKFPLHPANTLSVGSLCSQAMTPVVTNPEPRSGQDARPE
jgi:hypothetical protein